MDIVRKNFEESLPQIAKSIEDCEFLAIDGEFTGLEIKNNSTVFAYDTPEERYDKIRKGCLDFLLVQFGLCTFRYIESEKRYVAEPFNFYLFPRPMFRQSADIRFLCQSSSIDFLNRQGFDFNKLFREGISYLNPIEEQNLHDHLSLKHQQQAYFSSPAFTSPAPDAPESVIVKGPITVPEDQKNFIEDVCVKISEFMEKKSDDDSLELPPCSGFQRKLIYQVAKSKFISGIHLETKTSPTNRGHRYIVVSHVQSEEELRKRELEKQAAEMAELAEAVGFTKVMKMISKSGKLVLGHNMLLDVCHIIHQFYTHLPKDYSDFKSITRCILPRLVDTKVMSTTHPFRDRIFNTALDELHKALQKEPFVKANAVLGERFDRYGQGKEHEAGFDAYTTGLCYISMINFLGSFQNSKMRLLPNSALIEPFINRLFMMNVYDIPYMNLAGADLLPSRDHIFHVSFPADWKATELCQLFGPYGNIKIVWVDDTSAYVSLYRKDQAEFVLKGLKGNEMCSITPYTQYKARRKSVTTPVDARKRSIARDESDMPKKKHKSVSLELSESGNNGSTAPAEDGSSNSSKVRELNMETSTSEAFPKLFEEAECWE